MRKKLFAKLRHFWLHTELNKIIIVTVVALALIIFAVLSITTSQATRTHQNTVMQSCENYTDFVMHSTETELKAIYSTLHDYMKEPVLASAKNVYRQGKIDYTITGQLSNLFRSTIAGNTLIKDIIITFPDAPIVVSHNGLYSEEYYQQANPSYSILSDFTSRQKGSLYLESHLFYPEDLSTGDATRKLVLFYVTDFYRLNIVIDEDDFISAFDISHFYSEDMLIMITNSTDQLIISNDHERADKLNISKISEDEYLVARDAGQIGLKYYILYSKDIIKKDVNTIRNYYIIAFLITLVMFVIFIIVYNKIWVIPLKNFANNFLSASGTGKKNELVALLDYVDIMNKQIFEMSDYILYTKDTTNNAMMINAILYSVANKDNDEYNVYESNFFRDSFPHEKFVLAYFITGSFKESLSTGLSVALKEMNAKYEFCFISDDGFFAVINYSGSVDTIKQGLENFINRTNRLEIRTAAIISDEVDNISGISKCTEQISSIKNTRNVKLKTKLYTKDDIAQDRKLLQSFVKNESEFINIIKSGDIGTLNEELERILSNAADAAYGDCYSFFMYLHNFIIRVDSTQMSEPETEELPFLTLLSSGNLAVMDFEKIKEAFCETCLILCNRSNNSQNVYEDEIIRYIKENYNNFISLDIVAQKFGMNASYLSTYIKKKIGMSFVEYMRSLRIAGAKKLLTETDLDISKISENLGFSDTSSFIRYFKKSEGITPKQYRTSNTEN